MTDGSFQQDAPGADPQTKLRNMVLDFFYKQIRLGKTNQEIIARLHKTNLPPVNEDRINLFRREFKEKEAKFPEKMRKFRERLKVP